MSVAVSSLGDGLGLFGFPILVESLTKNGLWISLIFPMYRLPWLLAPMIGGVVDRCNARTVLIRADLTRAILLLGLMITVGLSASIAIVFVAAFGVGLGECFFSAAVNRLVPTLVSSELLPEANGRIYTTTAITEHVGGYALGGPVARLGANVPLIFDGFSFLASAILLRRVPDSGAPIRVGLEKVEPLRSMFVSSMQWIKSQAGIRTAAKFTAVMSFTQGMHFASLPVFARKHLRLSPTNFGLFVALIGVGTIVGSAIAARVWRTLGTARLLVGVGAIVACTYAVAGVGRNYLVAATALIIESIAVSCGVITVVTLHMQLIPMNIRGRVGNTLRTLTIAMTVLGGVVAATIIRVIGIRMVLPVAGLISGISVVFLAGALHRVFPKDQAVV